MGGNIFLCMLFVGRQSSGKYCLKVCGRSGSRWNLGHDGTCRMSRVGCPSSSSRVQIDKSLSTSFDGVDGVASCLSSIGAPVDRSPCRSQFFCLFFSPPIKLPIIFCFFSCLAVLWSKTYQTLVKLCCVSGWFECRRLRPQVVTFRP